MRKTNSKEVKKYFDEYLNDILTDEFEGKIEGMAEQFFASCSNSIGKLANNWSCYQDAFKEITWNFATPYYHDMKVMLMQALDQTEAEADKYSCDKIENLFNNLLYSAYVRKCDKEKINGFLFKY